MPGKRYTSPTSTIELLEPDTCGFENSNLKLFALYYCYLSSETNQKV
jgi:hypothetical protein